jgi:hypothetical protein
MIKSNYIISSDKRLMGRNMSDVINPNIDKKETAENNSTSGNRNIS